MSRGPSGIHFPPPAWLILVILFQPFGKPGTNHRRCRDRARELIDGRVRTFGSYGDEEDDIYSDSVSLAGQVSHAPFEKDFSDNVSYSPHTADDVETFMEEENIRVEGEEMRPIFNWDEVSKPFQHLTQCYLLCPHTLEVWGRDGDAFETVLQDPPPPFSLSNATTAWRLCVLCQEVLSRFPLQHAPGV